MAGPNLPTNLDSTYPDSAGDASVKLHQQYHDASHGIVNRFDKDATPASGQIPMFDPATSLYLPRNSPHLIAGGSVSGRVTIDVTGFREVVYTATLTGNTHFLLTGYAAGTRVTVLTVQDATGGREATFGTYPYQPVYWEGNLAHVPPIQPDDRDMVELWSRDGTALEATGKYLAAPRYGQDWHVYGNGRDALQDARVLIDANTTSGSPTLTAPSGAFSAQDIGRNIWVEKAGAAGVTLATTITAVGSATSITLAANASATLTSRTFNVSIASNSATTTAGSFLSTDVGRFIRIPGAGSGGGDLLALIDSFTSATVVTLHVAASNAVTLASSTVCLVATVAESAPAAPAATINNVLARAQPGDTVWVHRGVYANTTITKVATGYITVKAWPGDRVEIQGLQVTSGAAYLFFSGFHFTRQSRLSTTAGGACNHIVFDQCTSENFIQTDNGRTDDWMILHPGAHYITFQRCVTGNIPAGGSPFNQPRIMGYTLCANTDSPTGTTNTSWPYRPAWRDCDYSHARQDVFLIAGAQELTIERCVLHEPQHTGEHNDCIQMAAVTAFTIRRNIIHNWENWPAQPDAYPDQGLIIGHVDPVQSNLKCKGPGLVEHNLIHHTAGSGMAIAGFSASGAPTSEGLDINNNTIYDAGTGANRSVTMDDKSTPASFQNYNIRARNNIVERWANLLGTNQLVINLNNTFGPTSENVTAGTSQLSTDPLFVDNNRYRLGASSTSRDSGTTTTGGAGVNTPYVDVDGNLRDASTPDRGAREYSAAIT